MLIDQTTEHRQQQSVGFVLTSYTSARGKALSTCWRSLREGAGRPRVRENIDVILVQGHTASAAKCLHRSSRQARQRVGDTGVPPTHARRRYGVLRVERILEFVRCAPRKRDGHHKTSHRAVVVLRDTACAS